MFQFRALLVLSFFFRNQKSSLGELLNRTSKANQNVVLCLGCTFVDIFTFLDVLASFEIIC